ncbi:MAG: L-rhamnose mutarotase [Propionibacteriaceae bacterium]|jgi:L-rhamnose mutarotase|nr:L-rhamnose mutarotase [Propionibacteriaceae bacterium]
MRVAQAIGLPAENREAYIRYHAEVWPGVLKQITDSRIRNYSIYVLGETLFSYFEYDGDDYEADMAAMALDPETQRWWDTVKPLQRPFADRPEGAWWIDLEEVFHLD